MTLSSKLVLGCVKNLMLTIRIESIVDRCGYKIHWLENQELTDMMILDFIRSRTPTLIILDLGYSDMDWKPVIRKLKSTPLSSNIPIICFGSHKETEKIKAAKQAGADRVLARSRFFSTLPEIISKYGGNINPS